MQPRAFATALPVGLLGEDTHIWREDVCAIRWLGLPKKPDFKRPDFKTPDFRTFVTEQKMLLFMQVLILLGLVAQAFMFIAFLWYGKPPEGQYALIREYFLVAAVWVLTINAGIVLFWWVTKQGRARSIQTEPQTDETK